MKASLWAGDLARHVTRAPCPDHWAERETLSASESRSWWLERQLIFSFRGEGSTPAQVRGRRSSGAAGPGHSNHRDGCITSTATVGGDLPAKADPRCEGSGSTPANLEYQHRPLRWTSGGARTSTRLKRWVRPADNKAHGSPGLLHPGALPASDLYIYDKGVWRSCGASCWSGKLPKRQQTGESSAREAQLGGDVIAGPEDIARLTTRQRQPHHRPPSGTAQFQPWGRS